MDPTSAAPQRQSGRAVVLVGHGGVPRDYPRDRLLRLRGLEARRRATGAPVSVEEAALDAELRHWPRTPATDPAFYLFASAAGGGGRSWDRS
jgi:sirohydrochlorin cobaltochelatase